MLSQVSKHLGLSRVSLLVQSRPRGLLSRGLLSRGLGLPALSSVLGLPVLSRGLLQVLLHMSPQVGEVRKSRQGLGLVWDQCEEALQARRRGQASRHLS